MKLPFEEKLCAHGPMQKAIPLFSDDSYFCPFIFIKDYKLSGQILPVIVVKMSKGFTDHLITTCSLKL